jgi:tetratricopeptide (TPR) repeat protein
MTAGFSTVLGADARSAKAACRLPRGSGMTRRRILLTLTLMFALPVRVPAGPPQPFDPPLGCGVGRRPPPAWEALDRGDAAKAASLFREALDRSPGNAALHFGAGFAAHQLGRRDAALSSLRKAVEIDPDFVSALSLLARVAYAAGDLDLAVRSLEKAIRVRPDANASRQLEAWRAESSLHRGFAERPGVHFNILFEGAFDRGVSERVAAVLEAGYWSIGKRLNTYPGEALTVLLYTNQQFKDVTRAPEWSVGRFDGRIRLAVGGALATPRALDRVLTHELVHAMIAHAAPTGAPAWVHEGLASYFESSDHTWAARALRATRRVYPLDDLERGFGSLDGPSALVAYAESLVAAQLLVERTGPNLGLFLQMLGSGHTVDQALSTLDVRPDEFRAEWKRRILH